MKFYKYIAALTILIMACTQEQAIPVVTDFDVIVIDDDYSTPVKVKIVNKTTGADTYQWTIDGSSSSLATTSKNPGTILYENAGIYTIKLHASNKDGQSEEKEVNVQIYDAVTTEFEIQLIDTSYSPVMVNLINNSQGATFYEWHLEGGSPEFSSEKDPGTVTFAEPGEHLITLKSGNGFEEFSQQKTITVNPLLEVDFDWEVAFDDNDYQVPVTLNLVNATVSAMSYEWTFNNGTPLTSTEENPAVIFNTVGTHTITLQATNGKDTKSLTKAIEIYPNTNLRVFENSMLGINTAHNTDVMGAFFSTSTGVIYSKSEINNTNGATIDLVYFGLEEGFSHNRFIAPDEVTDETTFEAIPNATHTKFINNQELCACSASMTTSEFDGMSDDSLLEALTIEETSGGLQHFDNSLLPRIVIFETADGRKGAIKIKEYHQDGQNSYIIVDIKVQKEVK
jgi:PKD repeat protein